MIEIIQLLDIIFFILLEKSPSNIIMINNIISIILEATTDKEMLKANKTKSVFLILDSKDLFIKT
tara:strand:+ start:27 stop:221 length:195 start_codon:yes stop_codon:yes gene_type:complete